MADRGMLINGIIFIVLCIIWGSSFILIKEGIEYLSPYQVATIRILSAGLVLLPVAVRQWKNVPRNKLGYVFLSGLLGSFFPAYLFCIAETKIDSSLAGFLNSLTPVFTIFTGLLFFGQVFQLHKLVGVMIAIGGMLVLLFAKGSVSMQYLSFASFALVATILYGLNINLVGRHLQETSSLAVVAVSFALLLIPCFIILWATGYFALPLTQKNVLIASGASSLLGILGTAVATVLFYVMIKRAGGLLASMVTYGIPFIALLWGMLAGEMINEWQVVGLVIILVGVYITSKKKQK
ncbi:DMT family transporter [Niastella caeni]|uniref:DMT family transporter n=1 Tax=Niastella caeni TaxID=2569763 RepID=A0A4S8HVT2_9BACT|nr:DMT family transporter [Niastella caeni]THU37262.1 DMT family transporter [Niastella caeni]